MAKGDSVGAIGANDADLSFQPATGVEVMITVIAGGSGASSICAADVGASFTAGMIVDGKIPISNTIFMKLFAGGAGIYRGYAGIQVK